MTDSSTDLELRLRWLAVGTVTLFGLALTAGLVAHIVSPGSTTATQLLQAGIILLMLAPASRVLIAVAERIRRRDWMFVLMTVVVAVELAIVMWRASQKL